MENPFNLFFRGKKKMSDRSTEIQLLLEAIYSESTPSYEIFREDHYHHLLGMGAEWHTIHEILEERFDATARIFLRKMEWQYTQDFISQELSRLNLHRRSRIEEFERAIFLLGLIVNPRFTWEGFQKLLSDRELQLRTTLINQGFQPGSSSSLLDSEGSSSALPEKKPDIKEATVILEVVNKFVFEDLQIRGDDSGFLQPESHIVQSLINDHEVGIPLSISSVYLIFSQRLGLPVYGVNMPRHFLLKWESDETEFFIDPFHAGAFLQKEAVLLQLQYQGYPVQQRFVESCFFDTMIRRALANLSILYRSEKDFEKIAFIESLSRNIPV